MTITLQEITEDSVQPVVSVRLSPGQERFVSSVSDALSEAAENPQGNPWVPSRLRPPMGDHRHQAKGYGREVVRQIVEPA